MHHAVSQKGPLPGAIHGSLALASVKNANQYRSLPLSNLTGHLLLAIRDPRSTADDHLHDFHSEKEERYSRDSSDDTIMALMTDLIGSTDNLNEEPAFLNSQRNILGVVISFMVCALRRQTGRLVLARVIIYSKRLSDRFSLLRTGVDLDMRLTTTLHSILHY